MNLKIDEILIGKTLRTEQIEDEKFNVFWGLPILSSDAISSVAYAGEEMLWVLVGVLGLLAYKYMLFAALCIVVLLGILVFSYRQTIDSYPNGGGSYIVAKDNLGAIPGLTAGASLSIGYILTVAVSCSAGTAAITSALPWLLPHKVLITVALIVIMTIGNLRGIRESSVMFGVPTYLFIVSIIAMIIIGIVKVKVFGITPVPILSVPQAAGDITLLLFLRAFASGCTGLTGVEAVSNGIPSFKTPAQKNAKTVLSLLALLVFIIFGGISFLSTLYHAVPNSQITVVAQIAAQVFGQNAIMFYVIQVTTAIILIMAANTAYAGLPLLFALMAHDGYIPRQFTKRGKRLSFSNGIVVLSVCACLLVIMFKGDTHLLMPLYAVGVFISFTLSQFGMFTKWRREKSHGWKHKALINGFGAVVTFITVIIIGYTKFKDGAWIVLILIPILVYLMYRVREHYKIVALQLKLSLNEKPKPMNYDEQKRYVIVPIDTLNKAFLKAFNYARTLSENIIVIHVSVDDEVTSKLMKKWQEYNLGIPLVVKKSPYRDTIKTLVKFIENEEILFGEKNTLTVVLPQFVVEKKWQNILHNQTTMFIVGLLLKRRNIAVVMVPYLIKY